MKNYKAIGLAALLCITAASSHTALAADMPVKAGPPAAFTQAL